MSKEDKNNDDDNGGDEIFTDAEKGPDDAIQKDDIIIKEIRENISKNSLEIADLKNLTESIDHENTRTDDSNNESFL